MVWNQAYYQQHRCYYEPRCLDSGPGCRTTPSVYTRIPNTNTFLKRQRQSSFGKDVLWIPWCHSTVHILHKRTQTSQTARYFKSCRKHSEHHTVINIYGLRMSQVMTLLSKCLQCNVFRWSGEYFKQLRDLAVGRRLAPVLAVAKWYTYFIASQRFTIGV